MKDNKVNGLELISKLSYKNSLAIKEFFDLFQVFREQTNANFGDINDDIDDLRRHIVNIENFLKMNTNVKGGEPNETCVNVKNQGDNDFSQIE